ncbi:MAG: MerR family transcriptional regulator [Luteitalea sp.]|nr:MerR family transcriptional regulator [Luteitalea sp.]
MSSTHAPASVLRIGEVARQTGLAADTIRFYERLQVVRRPPRSNGGFRLYTGADIRELRFVRRLQALGLSLAEIRQLTAVRTGRQAVCSQVRDLFTRKLDHVREQIRVLQALERELESDLRTCTERLAAEDPGATAECPVLDTLDDEASPLSRSRSKRSSFGVS